MLLDAGSAKLVDDACAIRQNSGEQVLDVLANDVFDGGYTGQARITSVSNGSEGGRIDIADGGLSLRYAPPADFSGSENFVYFVDNQFSATVSVKVIN